MVKQSLPKENAKAKYAHKVQHAPRLALASYQHMNLILGKKI